MGCAATTTCEGWSSQPNKWHQQNEHAAECKKHIVRGEGRRLPADDPVHVLERAIAGNAVHAQVRLILRPTVRGISYVFDQVGVVEIGTPIPYPNRHGGCWITDNLSWPWLFYINLPVGTFCAISSWSILRGRESKKIQLPIHTNG
jgi:hypothetical protein